MRALWAANAPWVPTGYGTQTKQVTQRMKAAGVDIACAANFGLGGTVLDYQGIRVYPHGWEDYSNDSIPAFATHWFAGEPGLLITLTDVWTLKSPEFATLNVAAWTPIDHLTMSKIVMDFFERTAATPIAMSRFGQRLLEAEGLRPLYAPHAIDTHVYAPKPQEAARAASGLPQGAFVVGMVANNKGRTPCRKSFAEAFSAFHALRESHPDALLYVHAEKAGGKQGVNLEVLAASCDIPKGALLFGDQGQMLIGGNNDAGMVDLYASFDVLLAPSRGEGFGIPVVEAQACGTPVIVTNATAQPELCAPSGWRVDYQPEWDPDQCAWWAAPSIPAIAIALHEAYAARGDEALRLDARRHAQKYDADKVFVEHWMPILKRLEDRLPSAEPIVAEPVA